MSDFKDKINNLYQQKCSKYSSIYEKNVLPPVKRIIAIGDLHGDFNKTIECLKIAKVLEEDKNFPLNSKKRYKWIGGETVIVQIGDQIDRCRNLPCNNPNSTNPDENSDIKILKFFTDLHLKAIKKGGAVYSLVGNHEIMNVTGRMDYVSYKGIVGFEKENEYGDSLYQSKIPDGLTDLDAREWAFKPGNPLAEFIACTRKLVLKIGDFMFVHAGILPKIAEQYKGDIGIEEMNHILSAYLFDKLDKDEIVKHQNLLGPEIASRSGILGADNDNYEISPLWNRKYGYISRSSNEFDNEKTCNLLFNPIKKIYSIKKMFIGHTPQVDNKITSSCNNGLWFTDIGMSKAFNPNDNEVKAQVLEIKDGVCKMIF